MSELHNQCLAQQESLKTGYPAALLFCPIHKGHSWTCISKPEHTHTRSQTVFTLACPATLLAKRDYVINIPSRPRNTINNPKINTYSTAQASNHIQTFCILKPTG